MVDYAILVLKLLCLFLIVIVLLSIRAIGHRRKEDDENVV